MSLIEVPVPPPPIVTSAVLWEPGGDPAAVEGSAATWDALGVALEGSVGRVDDDAALLAHSWWGSASDAYSTRRTSLSGDVTTVAQVRRNVEYMDAHGYEGRAIVSFAHRPPPDLVAAIEDAGGFVDVAVPGP